MKHDPKNKNTVVEMKHLRTKIAAGYVLILLLVGGIIYTWLGEWRDLERLEAHNRQIDAKERQYRKPEYK